LRRKRGFISGGLVSAGVVLLKGLVPVVIASAVSSGPMLPVSTAVVALLAHLLTSGRRLLLYFILGATLGLQIWELAVVLAVLIVAARHVDNSRLLYLAGPVSAAMLFKAPAWFSEDAHTAWLVVTLVGALAFLGRHLLTRNKHLLRRAAPAALVVASVFICYGVGQLTVGRSGFRGAVDCPQIISGLPTGGTVALTFDDGPDPVYTPKVLKLLRQSNIKATFFVVGSKVARYPEIVTEIVADGHTIGNHSYTHRNLSTLGTQQLEYEIDWTQDAIEQATGLRPNLMRPPRGMGSPELFRLLEERGMTLALWSKSSQDWLQPTPSGIVTTLGRAVRSGDILLFHDSGDFVKSSGANRTATLKALPGIIVAVKTRGLQFVTMDEMIDQALAHGWHMGVPRPQPADGDERHQPGRAFWAFGSPGIR